MTNAVRAFSCDKTGSKEIAVTAATGPDNLPAGIVVPPGVYNIFGVTVDMTKEQLYRISDFDTRSAQVMSYASDFDALITSIAWTGQIGYGNVTYSPAMLQAVRTGNISTTCGAISDVAQALLAQANIVSRWTGGAVADPSTENGYDDGHTILEIQHNGKWCAYDFLIKFRFLAADGVTPLSLLDLHDALRDNAPITLSQLLPVVAPADVSKYQWLIDKIRSNPYAEYQRLFGLVYMPNGSSFNELYDTAAQQASIPARGMIPTSRADYIANFYAPIPPPPPPPPSSNTFVGEQPNTTSSWGALYTVADTNLQLIAGDTAASIGMYLNSPATLQIKVLQQISQWNFAVVQSWSFSHPGGGWADFTIPGGYVVPSTGIYRPGMSASLGNEAFSTVGTRALLAGNLASGQSGAFSYATNGGICMRWTKV